MWLVLDSRSKESDGFVVITCERVSLFCKLLIRSDFIEVHSFNSNKEESKESLAFPTMTEGPRL